MDERRRKWFSGQEHVDMKRLLMALLRGAWLIVLVALICAFVSFGVTKSFVTPRYEASVMFYVNNKSLEFGQEKDSYKRDNIWVARDLVETYVVILYAGDTLDQVIKYASMTSGIDDLRDMLTVDIDDMIATESVDNTEIFKVTVTSHDPRECERIADAIAGVLPVRIAEIVDKSSAKVVEAAVFPTAKSWPNEKNNLVLGGMFGGVLVVGIITMKEIFDDRIRHREELEQYEGIPVLSAIPDLLERDTGKKYNKYYYKQYYKKRDNGRTI